MKSAIITIVALLVIAVVYFTFFQTPSVEAPTGNTDTTVEDDDAMMEDEGEDAMMEEGGTMPADDSGSMVDEEQTPPAGDAMEPKNYVIVFNGDAYSPSTVNIKKGDTVTWRNDSPEPTWPASALHPTHTVYPTTGGCLGSTFDACRGLNQGETFTFQFDEVGTWRFHDHLNSEIFGSVVVTE